MSSSTSHQPEGYTVPPPGYAPGPSTKKGPSYGATAEAAAHEPLLGTAAGEGAAARNVWAEQGDDLEDDFKVSRLPPRYSDPRCMRN